MTDRLKLDRRGMRDLLRSEDVRRDLEARAQRVAAAAGPGHGYSSEVGHSRALAMVWTDDIPAMINEARHATLTSAIDAARG